MDLEVPTFYNMIPKTLEEAIQELIKINTLPSQLDSRSIRNEWGLWNGSKLAQWFYENDIYHADDMSAIIIDSYEKTLEGKSIDLKKQIQIYHKHWENCYGKEHLSIMREQTPFYKKAKYRENKINTIINDITES